MDTIEPILQEALLEPVFRPLVALSDGDIFGYAGAILGPAGSAPTALLAAATREGSASRFELACCIAQIEACLRLKLRGKLIVKLSAPVLVKAFRLEIPQFLLNSGISPGRVVVALSESSQLADTAALIEAVSDLRQVGIGFALDGFGGPGSSFQLWVELQPEFVELDPFFVRGIGSDPARFESVRLFMNYARQFGTQLIAKGVEVETDLAVLRDLGLHYAEGSLIGDALAVPALRLEGEALRTIQSRKIAVYPEIARAPLRHVTVGKLVIRAPGIAPETTNERIVELFNQHRELHALPVVERDQPIGLINRRAFMDRYVQPYHRELYGRRDCRMFMNQRPLVLDKATPLDSLTQVLIGEDQRYLADGFIVTDNGRYLGLGTGETLVRAVTEIRIEAARYANPLTLLPGNIPISEHIDRLLAGGVTFAACYCDLNQFKPYNDQYGYWRGDEMIKLAARIIGEECEPLCDFLGHVGGDDFIALFQSEDWQPRCENIVARFNLEAQRLFTERDVANGGIQGEDRHGNPTFFALTTISVGAVSVEALGYAGHEEVASAAAAAKRLAKKHKLGIYVLSAADRIAEPAPSYAVA